MITVAAANVSLHVNALSVHFLTFDLAFWRQEIFCFRLLCVGVLVFLSAIRDLLKFQVFYLPVVSDCP